MNCLKCGSKNLDEQMKCLDCGNDNHKGRHIDIDDIAPKQKHHHNFERARKFVLTSILFILVVVIAFAVTVLVYFVREKSNVPIMEQYNDYRKNSSVYVLYMGDNADYDKKLKLYKDYYEYDYQKINIKKLTIKNRRKFKEKLKTDNLKDSIAIYKHGKLIAVKNISNVDDMNAFLNTNKVIPSVIEDPKTEKELISSILGSNDDTLVYVSFVNNDIVQNKSNDLSNLCAEYKIKYQFIRGYVFSEKQIINYMNQFNYSSIKNELIVIVENGSIKKIIEFDSLYYDDYIEIFKNYDIINSITDYLNYVDINTFNELKEKDDKNIFVFGDAKCKYCESVKYTLGGIAHENNIKIHYVELNAEDNITESLTSLNYEGTYTYPLTIIIENKKIIDYIIGDSEKDYFISIFKKDGIIR